MRQSPAEIKSQITRSLIGTAGLVFGLFLLVFSQLIEFKPGEEEQFLYLAATAAVTFIGFVSPSPFMRLFVVLLLSATLICGISAYQKYSDYHAVYKQM